MEVVPQNFSRWWSLEWLFSSWERRTAVIKLAKMSRRCPSVWKWNRVLWSCYVIFLQPGCHCLLRKSDEPPESSVWWVDTGQWLSLHPVVFLLLYNGIGEGIGKPKVRKTCGVRWRWFSNWRWEKEGCWGGSDATATSLHVPRADRRPICLQAASTLVGKTPPVLLLSMTLHGIGIWLIWANCPSHVPFQSLAHP